MTTKQVRRLTINDVARELGVSKSAISAAFTGNGNLAQETRTSIREAAIKLGYEPNPHAQRLSNGHSRDLVALFCPQMQSQIATEKVLEIQRLLGQEDRDTPLYSSGVMGDDKLRAQVASLRRLCRQRPLAIVYFSVDAFDEPLQVLREYQTDGGLVVSFDYSHDLPCDQVIFDREHNTYQATRHLLELGHRKIGSYNVGAHRLTANSRMDGFERALQEFNLQRRKEWDFWGAWTETDGAQLAEQYLALKDRPTGMVIVNEGAAWAFINQLRRNGLRVPQDVSVVSHDDQPVARYSIPALTTVSQPVAEIAQSTVELLASRLRGEYSGEPRQVLIRGELKKRETAASMY